MEKKLLVPIDMSEISKEMVKMADEWGRRTKAKLHFLLVISHHVKKADKEGNHDSFLKVFESYLQELNLISKHTIDLQFGKPYHEIMKIVKKINPDLIIMAAHSHTSLGRFFLGSNTDYVLHHCNCPVYVHKQDSKPFENKIIVPIDYTDINDTVIGLADDWAERNHSELYFIHSEPVEKNLVAPYTIETGPYQRNHNSEIYEINQKERDAKIAEHSKKLEDYVATFKLKSTYHTIFGSGKPYVKIEETQNKLNAGLIIMAAHSHTMLNRFFLGSNTDYLLHHLNCPMYIYKDKYQIHF